MKYFARFAVLGAALVAAAPLASATTLLYGQLNTVSAADYATPPAMTVDAAGHAVLDLGTTPTGFVTGPPATGTLNAFYGVSAGVTDYSFDTAALSPAGVKILSISNGTDVISFFATSEVAFVPSGSATEGGVTLLGYLSEVGPTYPTRTNGALLSVGSNGLGNNFTEDLTAQAPEPSSLVLLGSGLVSAGGMLVRRRKVSL